MTLNASTQFAPNKYIVYVSEGRCFWNPAPSTYGNPNPEIGVPGRHGAVAIAIGTQEQMKAIVDAVQATWPQADFEEMLNTHTAAEPHAAKEQTK